MSELEEKAVLISVLEDLFNKTEDEPDYVETSEILAFAIEGLEHYDECDLMELAEDLQDADETVEMHPDVAKFVVSVYESEIEDGNSDAMCNLGAMYYVGRFGEQSYEKAFELYEMSYEAGNIQAAENLLKYSEYSFIEITNYLCFSSESHFIHTFKKYTGCTPIEFRNFYLKHEQEDN